MKLRNRVALVTGAAGQIGSAVARALAAEGASLCLADAGSRAALLEEIHGRGGKAIDFQLDVRKSQSVHAMVETTLAAHGRLDILVTVAGIATRGPAETLPESQWDEVLAINLKGVFLCCQAAMPQMRRQKYGRIVNIGSVLGKNGGNPRPWIDRSEQERAGNVAYGVSKAGVHAMTFYLAKELAADGITVNAVAPGVIRSPMTTQFPEVLKALIPVGRMGEAEEVAAAVAFLAGDSAGFITGEVLDVNGGMWCD